jgi:haloalkane dehalogenase
MMPAGTPKSRISKEILAVYAGVLPRERRFATAVFPREITRSRAFLQSVADGLPALADRPALLLWGDRDIAFRRQELARFESLFPDHETAILEGAGHYVQEEAPDEICERVRAWRAVP